MNKILPIILSVIFLFGAASAQIKDDPCLRALEETSNTLKASEIKNAGLESEIKLLREMLSLKDEKTNEIAKQRDFYQKMYENSTKIDTNSGLIVNELRVQLAEYRAENAALRKENDGLRSSRNWRTAIGFGVGVGTGTLLKR